MKPLGPTYAKNTFHYDVIARRGRYAIAEQRQKPGWRVLAYEVFIVRRVKEAKMFGTVVEAHESVPSNEEWGRLGWTYRTLEEARVKLRQLEDAEVTNATQKARKTQSQ